MFLFKQLDHPLARTNFKDFQTSFSKLLCRQIRFFLGGCYCTEPSSDHGENVNLVAFNHTFFAGNDLYEGHESGIFLTIFLFLSCTVLQEGIEDSRQYIPV